MSWPRLGRLPLHALFVGGCGLLVAGAAHAEGGRELDLQPATRYGFFNRLSIGTGVFTALSGSSADRRTFAGAPLSLEAYVGGTPTRWLGIGVGYARDDVFALASHDAKRDGDEPDLDGIGFHLETISLLVTAYPSPTSPFYGLATVGIGKLHVTGAQDGEVYIPILSMLGSIGDTDPGGFIFTLGGGYDWWVSEHWTVGVSGRLLVALLSEDQGGPAESVTSIMPTALLTFGVH